MSAEERDERGSREADSLGTVIGRALGGAVVAGVKAAYRRYRHGKPQAPAVALGALPPRGAHAGGPDSTDRDRVDDGAAPADEDEGRNEESEADGHEEEEEAKERFCHFCGGPAPRGSYKVHLHNKSALMVAYVNVPRCDACRSKQEAGTLLAIPFLVLFLACLCLSPWVTVLVGHPLVTAAIALACVAGMLAVPKWWEWRFARKHTELAPAKALSHPMVEGFLARGYEVGEYPAHYDAEADACFYCGDPGAAAEPYVVHLRRRANRAHAEVKVTRCKTCHRRQKMGAYLGLLGLALGFGGAMAAWKLELSEHLRTLAYVACGVGFTSMFAILWGWRWIMKYKYGYDGEEHGRRHPEVQRLLRDGYNIYKPKQKSSARSDSDADEASDESE